MYRFIKRLFDILLSLVGIIILIIPMIIIGVIVKIDSKGSVVFKQRRMGKAGKEFNIYKFRTMVENAETIGTGLDSFKDDMRVTKVGKVLRLLSLDEIPQLFNIIKGDMSIIGPRPPVYKSFKDYPNIDSKFLPRFTVRPGITGWAQVNGRNELTWDEKVVFDNEYIDAFNSKRAFLMDLKIFFKTIKTVFTKEGAYDK